MTSRLKRKLNDLGVDTGGSKANESFCLIGTPLPPLEKSKDTGEFVPLWKQEVRDEKGRRRLHGAFTGGFSAGYFNSVGSKEGWTPSTFVSSRGDRAKKKAARPEDFMDEEDLAELRENQKLVDEHEEMEFGGTAAEKRLQPAEAESQDPISAALAASLAPAPKDSVGARILKKMGWRPGQGIGPRITYAARKRQDAAFLDPSEAVDGGEDDDVEEAKKHMYSRKDVPVIIAPRKDNFHGLGYSPGMGLDESVGRGTGDKQPQGGPAIASGFGLGALNDADDDDIDVYDTSGGLGRSRVAFDDTLGEDDHHISIGSSFRQRATAREPRVPPGITQTFHDGTTVLKGFLLSGKPVAEDRWFPLPKIPPGWKPNPRRVWEKDRNKENLPTEGSKTKLNSQAPMAHATWKNNQFSADERGSMLGETPLPAKARSVFEYMSQKDRERLESIRHTRSDPSTAPPRPPSPSEPTPTSAPTGWHFPHIHPSVAKAALQGFQPFASDPLKHSRYTAFLIFQSNYTDGESVDSIGFGPLPGQSIDDFHKELDDYAKSATVFKPLSGAMAGRFRSAVVIEMGPKAVEGLHQPQPSVEDEEGPDDGEEEKKEDPRMSAVRMGMFGRLTREAQPWQPARLLCKRFGVKDPEVDMTGAAGAASADFEFATTAAKAAAGGDASAENVAASSSTSAPLMIEGASPSDVAGVSGGSSGPRNLANVGLGEDETQGRDILTYERPAMDVFKAIFASDDEDSEDEVEDAPKAEESTPALLDFFGTAKPVVKAESLVPPTANAPTEKVDLATFKPTFVPRSERDSRKSKGSEKKDKKGKDKDKKKARASLMSFDVEDDGSIPSFGPPATKSDRSSKRRKTREAGRGSDDDSMWVEKPAPEVVKNLPLPPVPRSNTSNDTQASTDSNEAGPPRGRKRAVDFM
ncbi:hypothetical protein BC628DRAFT_1311155 [Trametes gibbosa]|nr:hypothetical protein BC628DRAFT_1311155 [Trametes gibbosa]